jgi:hypothetical protein
MRFWLATLVLASVLAAPRAVVAAPLALASDAAPDAPRVDDQSGRQAVRGVVKVLTDDALTIARANRNASRLTFVLTVSTARSGTIGVGSLVSVRYRMDGDTRIATAVTARAGTHDIR